MVKRGKVVSFDRIKGYGFLASDTGGEDVFVHANDLLHDKNLMTVGSLVEFEIEQGERGPKASSVRLIRAAQAATAHAARQVRKDADTSDDLCDVLTFAELRNEVTELLLHTEPALTAVQILDLRERITTLADTHGWIED